MSELIKVTPKRVKTARIGRKTNQKSSFSGVNMTPNLELN